MKVGLRGTAALCAALCLWTAPALAQHDLGVGQTRDIVPRYLLQDVNGRATMPDDFRGRYQLITFGYTFCPDICPTTLTEMAAVLQALGPLAEGLQPIFVSVDPERDTFEVLKTYTAFFDPRIVGMTGSPALVSRAADNFKVRYQKVVEPGTPPDRYAVDHSAGMYLLGPDGAFVKKFAYATPPGEIVATIRQRMEEMPAQPPAARGRGRP
jgi:protein SCO1/2